jgi:septal ring factor EnvC (AmiA/AmiB activator)
MNELTRTASPEEEELRRKKEELASLEDQLAEIELEIGTLRADTQSFLDTVFIRWCCKLSILTA